MAQTNQQVNSNLSKTELLSTLNTLACRLDKMEEENKQLKQQLQKANNLNDNCKVIINTQRDCIEEISYWMLWNAKILSNPYLTSHEREIVTVYHDHMSMQKVREDGSRYYSVHNMAMLLGDNENGKSESKISKIHSIMQDIGLVSTKKEPQKGNRTKQNYYDIISMDFWLYPEKINLKDHSEWGGMRFVHKDCGGTCRGRMVYLCDKCGANHIEQRDITTFKTESEYNDYLDLMKHTESHIKDLSEIADNYEVTTHISELEREVNRDSIESFHNSMHAARQLPKKQKYALKEGVLLYTQELHIDLERGPP